MNEFAGECVMVFTKLTISLPAMESYCYLHDNRLKLS